MMEPMLDEFEKIADAVPYSPPAIELIANVTGRPAGSADCASAAYWRRHARQPVRFSASVQHLYSEGYRIFVEVGPAPVLTGMASRFIPDTGVAWLPSLRRDQSDSQQIFRTLGALYIRGVEIDWEGFYRHSSARRIPLPTYPFQRKRFWIDTSRRLQSEMPPVEDETWRNWLYEITWEAADSDDNAAHRDDSSQASVETVSRGCWLLLLDAGGVGERLEKTLLQHGYACVAAFKGTSFAEDADGRFHANPYDPEDYRRVVDAAMEKKEEPLLGVVNFWALDETLALSDGYSATDQSQQRLCGSALYLTQALAGRETRLRPRLILVTRGAQAVRSAADAQSVSQTTLWGLGKVIMLEHPELRCMCIDLDPQPCEAEMEQLFEGVLSKSAEEHQVALRQGQWWVSRLAPKDLNSLSKARQPFVFRADGAYLIPGGLSGLGLHLAQWLVDKGVRHLILMGRNAPSETASEVVSKLRERGAAVMVSRGNVADQEQVKRAIELNSSDRVPLCGVFHCAGILDDGILLRQNWERFRAVMAAKVQGAWNLHVATKRHKLDCFVLFSSGAALLGLARPGQLCRRQLVPGRTGALSTLPRAPCFEHQLGGLE